VVFNGETVLFFVNVAFESVSTKPNRLGQFRLHISTTSPTYVPGSSGFDFVTPFQVDDVSCASHTFVVTAPTGTYDVKLQARMATDEQCKIGQYNHFSCAILKL